MHNPALQEFTDSDWDILKAETRRALMEEEDGAQVDWNNPETGSGGAIKLIATAEYRGQTWRRAAFRQFTAKGSEVHGVYYLCHQQDDTWKFVTESEMRAAAMEEKPTPP